MPISNKIKGYISIAQTLLIALGANTMFNDPHSYYGLGIIIASAVIGALKHWLDTQDDSLPPTGNAGNQGQGPVAS